jgi:glycosyltransferase involved in cell wall biosynthesis
MRVAELTTYTSRLNGGVFYALSALLPQVAQIVGAGNMRVFGYADAHTEDDRDAWKPVEIEAFKPWPPRLFGYSPGYYRALADFGPEVIHAHGLWTYLSSAALKAHRRQGTPVIVSPHGMLDAWALNFSRFRKGVVAALFQDRLLNESTALHALNSAEAAAIRAYGLKNPIVVIPNGVSMPIGRPGAPPWSASRRDRVLLFLGRIHPKKGLDMLIRAWPGFVQSGGGGEHWRLIIAGWDEIGHEPGLRSLAADLGVADSVEFVGPLFGSAKNAALAAADAFVLTSRSEGLPMAVLEAWAHGKPALLTRCCNLPEGAAAGAAIEVEPEQYAVAEGLRRLGGLSDSERRAMGEAGLSLVEKRFNWHGIASDFARVYGAVASRSQLPSELTYPEEPGVVP